MDLTHSYCSTDVTRRTFLKAGATTAAVAALPRPALGGDGAAEPKEPLPERPLGRTGQNVSILNLGTAQAVSPRMLNAVYDAGIRYIDTADCYMGGQSEPAIAQWLADTGRRKELVIVTKDHPPTPDDWVNMVDARLEALQTDYIDMFFIHNLDTAEWHGVAHRHARRIPKMKKWAAAAEKIKNSGKVRLVGFSTHAEFPLRAQVLESAADDGWVDAIMVAYDPQLVRTNAKFDKALDACHKAGIGLICMKEMRAVADAPKFLPEFKEMGLTPHQAVLHAVWSDERIASICSAITNIPILEENCAAARNFKPMKEEQVAAVVGLYQRYGRTFCNACDGRCRRAGRTAAALGEITRYLSYCECDGSRSEARQLYAALSPEQRDWHNADLAAASAACASNLDFADLLPRAEQKLA